MTTAYQRPLPRISEGNRPFWEACKRRELLVQRCADCGAHRFPPRPMCPTCNSLKSEWRKVSGRGQVFSFIVVPAYPLGGSPMGAWPSDDYPINIAVVELLDAKEVRLVSEIVDCAFKDIRVGMAVEVVFEDITDEVTLPKFKPSG